MDKPKKMKQRKLTLRDFRFLNSISLDSLEIFQREHNQEVKIYNQCHDLLTEYYEQKVFDASMEGEEYKAKVWKILQDYELNGERNSYIEEIKELKAQRGSQNEKRRVE